MQRSTNKILSTLKSKQASLIECLDDGIGFHLRLGENNYFVSFTLSNLLNNANFLGKSLTTFLFFYLINPVATLRHYDLNPSKWFKLFFIKDGRKYVYEGPNVGVYKEIVAQLEKGICGANTDLLEYSSSFSAFSPFNEGETIASQGAFGVGNIFRKMGDEASKEFEECLIENLNVQNAAENDLVNNLSWVDILFNNKFQLLIFIGLVYGIFYLLLAKPAPAIMIDVVDRLFIEEKTFEKRLETIDELNNVPRKYCCPITQEIMNQPVILNSGQTFDWLSIEKLLAASKKEKQPARCPLTKKMITSVCDNFSVRQEIDAYVCQKEEAATLRMKAESEPYNVSFRVG